MKKVSVIGGGVIGLCTAYYLSKAGLEVTVFDSSDLSDGCSYGNAGMIVPSHIIPLAQPGMIAQGMKWMLDSKSPFYVQCQPKACRCCYASIERFIFIE
jgi:D-amino-acid dehydrogenase